MNEIKDTLAILKTRWIEVALIIGLPFLPNLLNHFSKIYSNLRILLLLIAMSIFLFVSIVLAGFLRTVYIEPDKRQSLLDLVRIGKHFFWRFFGFGILCVFVMMLFVGLLRITITNMGLNDTFPLANRMGFTFITLIFAKLILLIPAIIIVLDYSLSKSFGLMWKVKLLKAKPLLIIFLIQIIVLPYLLFFPNIRVTQPDTTWGYTIFTLYYIVFRILALMVQVMAVRFVSSLAIDCNEPYKPPLLS